MVTANRTAKRTAPPMMKYSKRLGVVVGVSCGADGTKFSALSEEDVIGNEPNNLAFCRLEEASL